MEKTSLCEKCGLEIDGGTLIFTNFSQLSYIHIFAVCSVVSGLCSVVAAPSSRFSRYSQ